MKARRAPKRQRNYVRWVFLFWLLTSATISLWRGLVLWRTRALLAEIGSKLSPAMLVLFAVLSVLCGIALGVSALGLWRRREWGRISARVALPGYYVIVQAYIWLFVQSGLMWQRRWVSLVLAICAVGIGVGALSWHKPRRWLGLY